ncbi:RNA polymerase sigma factor [Steroidobacter sp. S1-65]|uniref:RNA polymerase sigma factor n=1 Tax=Steroidobacter gossypii TaxID=2805490 RepID=A0ABS1X617_9GAMM|nr:RNA polymerase sigma factor [Steroidobacter gossypii]MBM0108663.1 RNA polymerase sigma factor [Steroidobacter gossypii]
MIDRHKHLGRGDRATATVSQLENAGQDVEPAPMMDTHARNGRVSVWFGRWRKPIRSWFSSRASVPRAEVDDLAQEVFLRLLRYSDDVAVENPQGYLFKIAANVANEWRDRSRVRQPHDRSWLDELQIDPSDQPDNAMFQSRVSNHLQSAVDQLPQRQREVLLLHVNEGLTYKQIADRLGVTYRIVLRDLTRAYASLRMQLKGQDL